MLIDTCVSVIDYLEAMPSWATLENRLNQFLELGSQPATSAARASVRPVNLTPFKQSNTADQQIDIIKQALEASLGANHDTYSSPQLKGATSINQGQPASQISSCKDLGK